MNPETELPEHTATGQPDALSEPSAAPVAKGTPAATESKRRAGVPAWRTGKPDAFLAAAVDVARTAVEGITSASAIGGHLGARTEGDRLVTHLFESRLPGYQGWHWFAVLTRNSRSKVVTVSELGLLPSEDSILAPEWVPWAERVRPEDAQDAEAQDVEVKAVDVQDEPESDESGTDEPDTEDADDAAQAAAGRQPGSEAD